MKINIEGKHFADISLLFLLDKMNNPDEILGDGLNPAFDAISEVLSKKGMRTYLMKYYLNLDGQDRIRYKRMRGVFTSKKSPADAIIDISRDDRKEIEEKEKSGVFKKIERLVRKFTGEGG